MKRTVIIPCLLAVTGYASSIYADGQKPNIIVILADDANTPCSVCMPTRYSLMMGVYPWRHEIGLLCRPTPMQLPANRPNIASMLKSEGYATGCVGKWHLGFGEEPVDWQNSLTPGPLERGFDYYFGFPINLNNPPSVYIENHQLIHPEDPLDKDGKSGAEKSRINFDAMT